MKASFTILITSLVKPFYRQNAGFFLFVFLVFFGVVAPSQQLAYHYALIRGLLEVPLFLGIVLLAWLLYAAKCYQWVISTFQTPEFSFLHLLSRLDKGVAFRLLLGVQIILYLPVWIYALAVSGVAFYLGRPVPAIGIQGYLLLLCLMVTAQCHRRLYHSLL